MQFTIVLNPRPIGNEDGYDYTLVSRLSTSSGATTATGLMARIQEFLDEDRRREERRAVADLAHINQ